MGVQKVLLCPFHCKTRPSGLSLASKGLENVPQVPGDPLEVCQNHNARKVVSVTLLVLKESGALFRSGSSTVSVQKVLLCPFRCKPCSFELLGGNIAPVHFKTERVAETAVRAS